MVNAERSGVHVGILARCADTSNWLQGRITADGAYHVEKRVSGTVTSLGTIAAGFGSFPILDFWYSLQLAVDVTGFWRFWVAVQGTDFNVPVLQGSDADLATGGGLATGKGGIYDVNTAASTCTRSYDNFYWWQPAADVSLVANQTMEWRHDGAIAEDAAGEVWVPKALDGDPALIPASGRDSRPLRTVILASRGDPRSGGADSGIDDISARWTLRPRIITVPTS